MLVSVGRVTSHVVRGRARRKAVVWFPKDGSPLVWGLEFSGFQKMRSPPLGTSVVWVAKDRIPSFGIWVRGVVGIFFFLLFPYLGKPTSYHLLAALKLTITKNTLSAFERNILRENLMREEFNYFKRVFTSI